VIVCFVLAGFAALANWWAVERDKQRVEYIAKPATTALLALAAVVGGADAWGVAALVFCLAGDVFLMLPADLFVPGLASFLVGHVLFAITFVLARQPDPAWGYTVSAAVVLVGVNGPAIVRGAAAQDARLRVPVVAYVAVIAAMVIASGLTGDVLAILGAVTFMVSDSILGRDRFERPIPHGRLATMVTYHAALALIVLSLI
jgi:uncharacterized membrane protein YhhN